MQTFLVIEQDRSNMLLLRQYLRAFNVHIVVALNGETGIGLASHLQPDLLIIDLSLSGLLAVDTLAHIRSIQGLTTIPAIGLGNDHMLAHKSYYHSEGFDALLHKPLLMPALLNVIENISENLLPHRASV